MPRPSVRLSLGLLALLCTVLFVVTAAALPQASIAFNRAAVVTAVVALGCFIAGVLAACSLVAAWLSRTYQSQASGARRFVEVGALAGSALFGAAVLGSCIGDLRSGITSLEAAIQGAAIGIGFLLLGVAGLYGAAYLSKNGRPSYVARAYYGSRLGRNLVIAAGAFVILYFLISNLRVLYLHIVA